jgi:hypothetical protein
VVVITDVFLHEQAAGQEKGKNNKKSHSGLAGSKP